MKSALTLLFLCLLLSPFSRAADPVGKDKPKTMPVKVDELGNLVLITQGPNLRGHVGLEFEGRFFRSNEDPAPESGETYDSYVSAIRFVDYNDHQTYELTWNPFGGASGAVLIEDKNLLFSPDHRWIALPIYQHGGIYFEKVDTLPHSLETNQAAGFLLTGKSKSGPLNEGACWYHILEWKGPHTVSLQIQVAENLFNATVDLQSRTVDGKLPDKMTELVFGPMESLGAKKLSSAKPVVDPKGNAPVVPLTQDPNQARISFDSVKSLTADIYYYLSTSNNDSAEITLKFERHNGQKSFSNLIKLLQNLRVSYPGKFIGKQGERTTASSAASVTKLILHPSTGNEFTLILDDESSIEVEDKDGIYFFRRMDHSDKPLFFRLLEAADVQKSEKTEIKSPGPSALSK